MRAPSSEQRTKLGCAAEVAPRSPCVSPTLSAGRTAPAESSLTTSWFWVQPVRRLVQSRTDFARSGPLSPTSTQACGMTKHHPQSTRFGRRWQAIQRSAGAPSRGSDRPRHRESVTTKSTGSARNRAIYVTSSVVSPRSRHRGPSRQGLERVRASGRGPRASCSSGTGAPHPHRHTDDSRASRARPVRLHWSAVSPPAPARQRRLARLASSRTLRGPCSADRSPPCSDHDRRELGAVQQ